jgi:hypothetical protein
MIRLPPRLELVLLRHSKRNSEEENNAVGDLDGMEEADPGMDEVRKKGFLFSCPQVVSCTQFSPAA